MTDIKSMTIDELKELMTVLGDKPFRAKQIYSWLHEHLVTSYDEMTNLSKKFIRGIKRIMQYLIYSTEKRGGAGCQSSMARRKYLFRTRQMAM